MTPWQRRLRIGLGVFVVALATLLGVSLWNARRTAVVPPLPAKADPAAIVESTSGGLVRNIGGRQDLTIEHYDKLEGYADGRTKITGGRFKILQRGGRDFSIRARVAEMKGTAPDVDVTMTGAVEMVSSDGLTVRAEQATYAERRGSRAGPGCGAVRARAHAGHRPRPDLRQGARRPLAARPGRHPDRAGREGRGGRRTSTPGPRVSPAPTSTRGSSAG